LHTTIEEKLALIAASVNELQATGTDAEAIAFYESAISAIEADTGTRQTRTQQTAETIAAIAAEYERGIGLYKSRLLKNGVAPMELDDSISELFLAAVKYAHTYDASLGKISTWLGNPIVRTVASSLYGKRRPAWVRAAQLEDSVSTRRENEEEADAVVATEGVDLGTDAIESVAVKQFLSSLRDVLTVEEMSLLETSGLSALQDGMSSDELKNHCESLNLTKYGVRKIITSLRKKLKTHACVHFGTDKVEGRTAFIKKKKDEIENYDFEDSYA
jgi:hypothetical protein